MLRKRIIALALFLLPAFAVLARQQDSLFTTLAQYGFIHGNVLVAEKGNTVYAQSFGRSHMAPDRPNTPATAFELASLSKVFTAVAVMQLVEKHQLQLNAPVQQYLPAFPYPAITIRHLLSHTSGLPDFEIFDSLHRAQPARVMTNTDIIPVLQTGVKLLSAPGEEWHYSSPGIGLLTLIIEKVNRQNFRQYLAQHIFKPAGMQHSYVMTFGEHVNDPLRADAYMHAAYYDTSFTGADTLPRNQHFLHVSGGVEGPGLMVSTANDLFRFDQALYNGKLLRSATIDTMYTPARNAAGDFITAKHYPGTVYFGLGWFILPDTSMGKTVFHSGFKMGTATMLLRNTGRKQTVILLDNGHTPNINITAFNALHLLNGMPATPLKANMVFSYGNDLLTGGSDYAAARLHEHRNDTLHYAMTATDWIAVAYDLFRTKHPVQSLETFRMGSLLYPAHPFLCLVYADVLKETGHNKEALLMYQRCLALDPDNKAAREKLAQPDK